MVVEILRVLVAPLATRDKRRPYRIVTSDEREGTSTMSAAGEGAEDRRGYSRCPLVLLNHHFSGFHHGSDGIAFLESQFFGTTACNDALDKVFSYPNHDMRHYVAEHDLLYLPT
jgi:hypothetical protein